MVSGALALMMEHFRGTMGNDTIVRRMMDTANNRGVYANLAVYGAGLLDLEAALAPVGTVRAGPRSAPLARSAFTAPSAYGDLGARLAGVEIAGFDAMDFPFWSPLSSLVATAADRSASPIPAVDAAAPAPAPGLGALGLAWADIAAPRALWGEGADARTLALGFGDDAASVALRTAPGSFGFGASIEQTGHLDGHASGAFDATAPAVTVWATRGFARDLGGDWSVRGEAALALAGAREDPRAVLSTHPALLSAASVRVGTERTGFTLAQPLRAEAGAATVRVETGHVVDGQRERAAHRVSLVPDARALTATVRHERPALGGTLALEAGAAVDAGHREGATDAHVGAAWRLRF